MQRSLRPKQRDRVEAVRRRSRVFPVHGRITFGATSRRRRPRTVLFLSETSFEPRSLHHRRVAVGQRVLRRDRGDRRPLRGVQIRVLRLPVPSQVHLPLESSAAELAGERLEAGVLPRVRDQVTALRERLAAYLTLVRLLAWNRNGKCSSDLLFVGTIMCFSEISTLLVELLGSL